MDNFNSELFTNIFLINLKNKFNFFSAAAYQTVADAAAAAVAVRHQHSSYSNQRDEVIVHNDNSPEPPTPPCTPIQTITSSVNLNNNNINNQHHSESSSLVEVSSFSSLLMENQNLLKSESEINLVKEKHNNKLSSLISVKNMNLNDNEFGVSSFSKNINYSDHELEKNDCEENEQAYDLSIKNRNESVTEEDDDNNDDFDVNDVDNDDDDDEDDNVFNPSLNDDCSFDSNSRLSVQNVESILERTATLGLLPLLQLTSLKTSSNELKDHQFIDYTKTLRRCASHLDCNNEQCKLDNTKEHYHCYDSNCFGRILSKKEEIIRHLKWHKKRSENLNHGFLRFSSWDDCTIQFGMCQHNRKQTHYHCIQGNCDKVYISTSDVQMHSNYHRKDSAIYQEGFQRFRASEECNTEHCTFSGQRTTHFHCRRFNCNYTFKNKADMEKHKTYHIKDEQLARDGFKKFLKAEPCPFQSCRFSRVNNHIHCTRDNCSYVLHSSGQLLSHKRKHEKIDSETAYRRYKTAQQVPVLSRNDLFNSLQNLPTDLSLKSSTAPSSTLTSMKSESCVSENHQLDFSIFPPEFWLNQLKKLQSKPTFAESVKRSKFQQNESQDKEDENINQNTGLSELLLNSSIEEILPKFFSKNCTKQKLNYTEQNEPLNLNADECKLNKLDAIEIDQNLVECFAENDESHLHCLINDCDTIVLKNFNEILEHLREHNLVSRTIKPDANAANPSLTAITPNDKFVNRKRGRPPKNRDSNVYNNIKHSPQPDLVSTKQENDLSSVFRSGLNLSQLSMNFQQTTAVESSQPDLLNSTNKFKKYSSIHQPNTQCPNDLCPFKLDLHFHCNENLSSCYFAADNAHAMEFHFEEIHEQKLLNNNFIYFDRLFNCRVLDCDKNGFSHFHCKNCLFTYKRGNEEINNSEHNCVPKLNLKDNINLCNYINSDIKIQKCNEYSTNTGAMSEPSIISKSSRKSRNPRQNVLLEEIRNDTDDDDVGDEEESHHKTLINNTEDNFDSQVIRTAGTYFPQNSEQLPNNKFQDLSENEINACNQSSCKLKKKLHYHCDLCNQAFCDELKLKMHFVSHQSTTMLGRLNPHSMSSEVEEQPSTSTNNFDLTPQDLTKKPSGLFENLPVYPRTKITATSLQQSLPTENYEKLNVNLLANFAAGKFEIPKLEFIENQLLKQQNSKKRKNSAEISENLNNKLQKTNQKHFKDEPIPTGYTKFRFNEDCNFTNCGYRNHQSHFHCCRMECFYSFCDKTRFVQHTARHERLDKLMGDDFKQYRANMSCGFSSCTYNKNLGPNNKSSHFHCLKCDFICSDTNKVVAHRRQHNKMEYIRMAGFRKISNNENCTSIDKDSPTGECSYSLKQTHYHCLVCDVCVVSRAQLGSHRHRS